MNKPDYKGYAAALAGPAIWGLMPLLYHMLAQFPALEVVVQRSLWSFILLALYFYASGQAGWMRPYFKPNKEAALVFLGAVMIGINWLVFVYAVMEGRVVEASFGYFIYPLVAVGTGVLFLKEKLDKRSRIALGLSACGVIIKGISIGMVPDVSLALAVSFALYALIRKQVKIDALKGLYVETVWLMPLVILYLLFNSIGGAALFLGGGLYGLFLSFICGVITIVPLALFLRGNKTLPLSLTGFIFYINPTMQLMVGTLLLGEAFSTIDLLAFGLIWCGLIVQFARNPRHLTAR